MRTIELKIKVQDKQGAFANLPSTLTSLDEWKQWFDGYTNKTHHDHWCVIAPEMVDKVREQLSKLDDLVEIRSGITDGCYGSRPGTTSEGLTVWLDTSLFPERWIDADGDEIVNMEVLLNDHAECLEDLDPDQFRESMDALGIESTRDNTYNYMEHDSDTPFPMQTVDFEAFKHDEQDYGYSIVIAKFHFGGDPRGNYSSERVYKLNDPEDFYSVFNPHFQLKEED